jgi:hypothetical protein
MARLGQLIKEKLSRELGYAYWIARYVDVEYLSDDGEARFCCVAHKESTSSCHFNINSGLWKCQASSCGESGDAIDFYYWAAGCKTKSEAVQKLALELGLISPITDQDIEQHHRHLFDSQALLKRAEEMFHVGRDTLQRFKVGYVRREGQPARFTIPIWGESESWEDIRLYNRQADRKIMHWAKGHGACRVWPIQTLRLEPIVFFMAGEKDTLRASENELPAITVTGAEGTLPDNFARLFRDKTVYVCFDVDEAGKTGALKVARRLATVAKSVFLMTLPSEGLPANGDYTDWCDTGHTKEEWDQLVLQADRIEPVAGTLYETELDSEPQEVTFRDLQSSDLYGKPIRFLAHAMGKSHGLASYQVPTEVLIDCPRNQGKLCAKCELYRMDPAEKPWSIPISYRNEKSLQMFRVSDIQQNHAIRTVFGINHKCDVVQISSTKRQHIQHLLLSPAVELAQMREDYNGLATAYYHGEPITDNRDYWFTGYLQADPKSQQAVLNLHSSEPARNAIENFVVNEEVYEAIEWFQPRNGETIEEHFKMLHGIIEEDTGIWAQWGIQQAALECIYSVLDFRCGNHHIENGWIEILIIGDTGVAKTTCSKRIMEMINIGELISGETVSAAGLIGGIEFVDRIPITKWGALPRNHCGFVVLDEIDAMQTKHKDIISQLTALRSSGMAEITKIHNAKTPTKVRLLWLTNPQEGRAIASYNGACRAIDGVINSRQDIARFTKVYAVASDSVNVQTITQLRERNERPGVRRHFNNLAILTWSLTAQQVEFTEDAQVLLRKQAQALTQKYHESIPLLEKGRAFDKLAKLSVPIAVLSGSFRTNSEKVILIVDTPHVAYAIQHLESVYDSKAMGYSIYSTSEYARETITDIHAVETAITQVVTVSRLALLQYFLRSNTMTRTQLEEFVGDRFFAYSLWSSLIANNCFTQTRSFESAIKTQAFARFIELMLAKEMQCVNVKTKCRVINE